MSLTNTSHNIPIGVQLKTSRETRNACDVGGLDSTQSFWQ